MFEYIDWLCISMYIYSVLCDKQVLVQIRILYMNMTIHKRTNK